MNRNIFIALVMLFNSSSAFSQDVIIGGTNNNRPLTWHDFKGRPDLNSSHDALTHWEINYILQNIRFTGDTVKIGNFSVKLELNTGKSWTKPEKQTVRLLKHEQGHFDLGLICQREMLKQLHNTVFLKAGFQDKIKNIFTSILQKYQALSNTYDAETNHSINQEAQDKWNNFFTQELAN